MNTLRAFSWGWGACVVSLDVHGVLLPRIWMNSVTALCGLTIMMDGALAIWGRARSRRRADA